MLCEERIEAAAGGRHRPGSAPLEAMPALVAGIHASHARCAPEALMPLVLLAVAAALAPVAVAQDKCELCTDSSYQRRGDSCKPPSTSLYSVRLPSAVRRRINIFLLLVVSLARCADVCAVWAAAPRHSNGAAALDRVELRSGQRAGRDPWP